MSELFFVDIHMKLDHHFQKIHLSKKLGCSVREGMFKDYDFFDHYVLETVRVSFLVVCT